MWNRLDARGAWSRGRRGLADGKVWTRVRKLWCVRPIGSGPARLEDLPAQPAGRAEWRSSHPPRRESRDASVDVARLRNGAKCRMFVRDPGDRRVRAELRAGAAVPEDER